LDDCPKAIGYRSVLTLADKYGKKSAAVAITKGADFRKYNCSSLRDVLAFEEYANSLGAERRGPASRHPLTAEKPLS
jgi:hypothetical protein